MRIRSRAILAAFIVLSLVAPTLATPNPAHAQLPGQPAVYVTRLGGGMLRLNPVTGTVADTGLALSSPRGAVFSPDGLKVYAPDFGMEPYLSVIETGSDHLIAAPTNNAALKYGTENMAIGPLTVGSDMRLALYVPNSYDNPPGSKQYYIKAIDANDYTTLGTIPLPASPRSLALTADGATLYTYAYNSASGECELYVTTMPAATSVKANLPGTLADVAVLPDGRAAVLVQVNTDACRLLYVTPTGVVTDSGVALPYGDYPVMAIDAAGSKAYIGLSSAGTSQLVMVRLADGNVSVVPVDPPYSTAIVNDIAVTPDGSQACLLVDFDTTSAVLTLDTLTTQFRPPVPFQGIGLGLSAGIAYPDEAAPTWPGGAQLQSTAADKTSITFAWTAASDNVGIARYEVLVDGVATPVTTSATTASVTGLQPDTEYTARLRAYDYAGLATAEMTCVASTTVDAQAPTWPDAADANVSNIGRTSLTVEWPTAFDDTAVTGCRLTVAPAQGAPRVLPVPAGLPRYAQTITGLTASTRYTITIEALDAAGNASTPLTVTVTTAPARTAGAQLELINLAPDGAPSDDTSVVSPGATSNSGRYTVFATDSANLGIDTHGSAQVFLFDRETGSVTCISATPTGAAGNGDSDQAVITPDGSQVVFISNASDLVTDANLSAMLADKGFDQVFVWTRATGQITLVSVAPDADPATPPDFAVADGDCSEPSISADGTRVAFLSEAADLSPASDGTYRQVFVRDLGAGSTSLVSVVGVGQVANAHCLAPQISGDGRFVAYSSLADNLVIGDANTGMDAFICDLTTGATSLLALTPEGAQADGQSAYPVLNETGRYVAFLTNAAQWGGAGGQIHLVRLDRQTGLVRFIADITEAETTMYTSLTADGQTLAYSTGDVAVPGSVSRIFLYDAATDTSTCLTPDANGHAYLPALSPDGYYLAFGSEATNLVPGYAPEYESIYLRRLKTPASPPSGGDPILPPAPPTTLIPPTGGQASTTLGTGLTLVVPPQALPGPTQFAIAVPDAGPTIIPLGATLLAQYQITATNGSTAGTGGQPGAPVTSFARPIQLEFGGLVAGFGQPAGGSGQPNGGQPQLTPAQAADAYVCYWDTGYRAWIPVPTEFDPVRGVIIGHTDHLTTYSVMLRPDLPRFTDINDNWAASHILKLAALEVVSGNGDGTFGPNDRITREQFAKMVVLAAGLQPDAQPMLAFADTDQIADWAKPYVSAAVRAGIINGLDGNRFAPQQLITRVEVATMVARALRNAPAAQASSGIVFADAASIPDWARASVDAAVSRGIVGGYADGTFGPQLTATRAEASKMLAKLADLLLKGK